MTTARMGTATTRPTTPSSVPITRTLVMVSTGGSETWRSMMRGTTTLASTTCTATPSAMTASTRTQSPVPTTNRAGKSVETSVPKNGTTATSPVKIPNASQYGTPSTHSPIAVRRARTSIARICPTSQAREHGGGEAEWAGQAKAALEQVGDGREVHRAQHRDEHEDQHLDHPHDEQDGEGGNEERHECGARRPRGGRLRVQRWGSGGASSSSTSSASAAPFPSCLDSPDEPAGKSPSLRFSSSSCWSASAFTSRLWNCLTRV